MASSSSHAVGLCTRVPDLQEIYDRMDHVLRNGSILQYLMCARRHHHQYVYLASLRE
jgi:hypothetical protein